MPPQFPLTIVALGLAENLADDPHFYISRTFHIKWSVRFYELEIHSATSGAQTRQHSFDGFDRRTPLKP